MMKAARPRAMTRSRAQARRCERRPEAAGAAGGGGAAADMAVPEILDDFSFAADARRAEKASNPLQYCRGCGRRTHEPFSDPDLSCPDGRQLGGAVRRLR